MQPSTPDPPSAENPLAAHDPYVAVRHANFRRYWIGNFVAILGTQMQTATVVWEVFQRTDDYFMVGLVDLVLVIPVLSLVLLAGHVADRLDRRLVLMAAVGLTARSFAGAGVRVLQPDTHRRAVRLRVRGGRGPGVYSAGQKRAAAAVGAA